MGYKNSTHTFEQVKKNLHKKEYAILLEQLYQLRLSAGMRQSDLADKLGVPQSFVSKIETGERNLDIVELRVLCIALGSNLEEFTKELERKINESR